MTDRQEVHRRAAEFLAAHVEKARHLPPSAELCIHWMAEFAIAEAARSDAPGGKAGAGQEAGTS